MLLPVELLILIPEKSNMVTNFLGHIQSLLDTPKLIPRAQEKEIIDSLLGDVSHGGSSG